MSDQPPSNNKNWLYFAFGSGTVLLLGSIAFLLFLNKSAQSQIAGTWIVDANDLPSSRTPPITIVISAEGKIIAIDPQNGKQAIKVGKITRVSDAVTLPNDIKLQSDLSNQGERARQSEAKTYVGSLNRVQQAYYLEKNKWAKTIDEAGVGVPSETETYRYNIQSVSSIKTVKDYPGITVQTGLAKKEGLKSYLGVTYLLTVSGGDISTFTILCESNEPTTKEAGLPKFDGKAMECPDGYANVSR